MGAIHSTKKKVVHLKRWTRLFKTFPVGPNRSIGRDPFNQNSDPSDREKRTTSKGGPVFSKLFRLDRTDPLSFGPKFPEILVEWIAPYVWTLERTVLSPPLTLLIYTLFSHDGVRLHDVCSTSDTIYYTRQMKVK